MQFINKRRHKRAIAQVRTFVFDHESGSFIRSGYVLDLSLGGLKMELNAELDKTKELQIKFFIPGQNKLKVFKAKAVRITRDSFSYIYGLRLVSPCLFDKLKLWLYVKTHTQTS